MSKKQELATEISRDNVVTAAAKTNDFIGSNCSDGRDPEKSN